MKSKDVLVLPDLHLPYEDKKTLSAVEKLMAAQKWDEVIYIGDLMDFLAISDYEKNNRRLLEGKRLKDDYDHANALLDRHQALCPLAEFTILQGNHDERMERFIDKHPELEGLLEVEINLHLKERGIRWIPFWRVGKTYKIGKATFGHGDATGKYHAYQMVRDYGCNVYYGHTHDVQSYPLQQKGDWKTKEGHSLGCLIDFRQAQYMRGRANKWQQAIGVFHFWEEGDYQANIIRIFKHRFYYNNRTYQG